mmetsp:Transcript_1936/g.4232  ORF Transcript_1936/g.4232 Transcript_1936/m.4232 type:complete len:268 (-) Transcript_1936:715-1518(-)
MFDVDYYETHARQIQQIQDKNILFSRLALVLLFLLLLVQTNNEIRCILVLDLAFYALAFLSWLGKFIDQPFHILARVAFRLHLVSLNFWSPILHYFRTIPSQQTWMNELPLPCSPLLLALLPARHPLLLKFLRLPLALRQEVFPRIELHVDFRRELRRGEGGVGLLLLCSGALAAPLPGGRCHGGGGDGSDSHLLLFLHQLPWLSPLDVLLLERWQEPFPTFILQFGVFFQLPHDHESFDVVDWVNVFHAFHDDGADLFDALVRSHD